ncbi:hypothetical protein L484_020128 [Morus notabilis]|uniref:Uncharacterized protein n=1 Tax=Morus notabilis TaxID=981085 RepID=W9RJK0_9ROSA|nr:hypothetical protein L484_020128 [Morus notabilis]
MLLLILHAPLNKKYSLESAKSAVLPMASSDRNDVATPEIYLMRLRVRLLRRRHLEGTEMCRRRFGDVGIYIVQDFFFYIYFIIDSSCKVEKFNVIQNQLREMLCS